MPRHDLRDLVVALPGITGSVLTKDGKDLWALSGRAAWEALKSALEPLKPLMPHVKTSCEVFIVDLPYSF
jgi:hypothetical protein